MTSSKHFTMRMSEQDRAMLDEVCELTGLKGAQAVRFALHTLLKNQRAEVVELEPLDIDQEPPEVQVVPIDVRANVHLDVSRTGTAKRDAEVLPYISAWAEGVIVDEMAAWFITPAAQRRTARLMTRSGGGKLELQRWARRIAARIEAAFEPL